MAARSVRRVQRRAAAVELGARALCGELDDSRDVDLTARGRPDVRARTRSAPVTARSRRSTSRRMRGTVASTSSGSRAPSSTRCRSRRIAVKRIPNLVGELAGEFADGGERLLARQLVHR